MPKPGDRQRRAVPPPASGGRYPRSVRLTKPAEFDAVYAAQQRKGVGPLLVLAKPNGLSWSRLGLSVPRRAGHSPRRQRFKRVLREAFRLNRLRWPSGYDIVVVVRAHEPRPMADYADWLETALLWLDKRWGKQAENPRDHA